MAGLPQDGNGNAGPLPAILVAGADGLCTFATSRWHEMTGSPAGGSLGDGWLKFIHPEDRARVRQSWLAAVREQRDISEEFRIQTAGNESRLVELRGTPMRSSTGPAAGYLATVEDLTERKRAEADALHAQKMEAIGRLAGGLAHDFANLLTLISGYSELLLNRAGAADPLRAELEEIRKAASRGSAFTARLLAFSRRHEVVPRILDLNDLVADMASMLRRMIGEHIELTLRPGEGLGKVTADPGQLEQVIMNLAINARDAMPQGGRLLIETANVELEPDPERPELVPGAYVLLRFRDTGHGMNAATLSRLFEPFFTTKDEGKGTGLGLATVYGIVRQYRGDVRVESAVGRGTTFTICLPRAEAAAEPLPEDARLLSAGRGNETVLLVEDEEPVRRLLKHMLVRCGYQIVEAADGVEALAVYQQQAIQALVTDIVMPRMDGRELAGHLLELQPDLKVIYISGYTSDPLVCYGGPGTNSCFLPKPVRGDLLSSKLRELLDAGVRTLAPSAG